MNSAIITNNDFLELVEERQRKIRDKVQANKKNRSIEQKREKQIK